MLYPIWKANVLTVLEPWLLARGGAQALCGLRLHSDRGGEFSSTRLETFCQVQGIIQSYAKPALSQQNGIAERRIGMVMEVARTSMCHAGAPQFLWPQAFYDPVTHQYFASHDVTFDKLSPCTRACVFLGFPLDNAGWVLYDPLIYEFFSSHDITFDDPPPVAPVATPPSRPALSGVSYVTPQSTPLKCPVPVVSRGAGGAVVEGEGNGAAGAGGVVSGVQGTVPQFPPHSSMQPDAAEPGGVPAGSTGGPEGVGGGSAGSGGARAGGTSTVAPTLRTVRFLAHEQRLLQLEREEREWFERAKQQLERVEEESEQQQERAEEGSRLHCSHSRRGQRRSHRSSSRGGQTPEEAERQRLRLCDLPDPAPARFVRGPLPSPPAPPIQTLSSSQWTLCSPLSRAVSPHLRWSHYRADGPFHLVLRSRALPHLVLPHPPELSLTVLHDPLSEYLRASRPVVSRVLSALVTHLTAPLSSISALVAAVAGFASSHRLDYATHVVSGPALSPCSGGAPIFPLEVLQDRQFELGFLATAVKRPPGSPSVFKACYLARGFSQLEGVDFFHTFAPTVKMTTLRMLLHIAAQCDYELHSLEFSIAFLQRSLHEQIWLRCPPAFTGNFPPGTQWQLRRPVYGLRQAPRVWHDTLRMTLAALYFFPSSVNPSLFIRHGSTPFFVLVYVDDLVFATPDRRALACMKEELQRRHTCTGLDPHAVSLPVLQAVAAAAAGESRGGVTAAVGESRGGLTTTAARAVAATAGESRGGVTSAAAGVVAVAAGEIRGGVMAASGEGRAGFPPAAAGALTNTAGESRGVTAAAGEGSVGVPVAAARGAAAAAGEGRGGAIGAAAEAGTVAADARGGGAAAATTARPPRPSTCTLCSWSPTVPSCSPRPVPFLVPVDSSFSPQSCCVSRAPSVSLSCTRPVSPCSQLSCSTSSALVTTVAGFASSHRLDYATHVVSDPARSPSSGGAPVFPLDVLEDRQFYLGFLAVAVPHLCAMLLAPEGDPDALDILIPRTHAKAVSGPWASYWIAVEDTEMASYRSTGTYVDAVLPPGTNVVSGIWIPLRGKQHGAAMRNSGRKETKLELPVLQDLQGKDRSTPKGRRKSSATHQVSGVVKVVGRGTATASAAAVVTPLLSPALDMTPLLSPDAPTETAAAAAAVTPPLLSLLLWV
ncbi:unnamed protein product [Closterium sp. NIES-53]